MSIPKPRGDLGGDLGTSRFEGSLQADSRPLSRGLPQLAGSQAGELHHLADRGPPKRHLLENLRPHAAGLAALSLSHPPAIPTPSNLSCLSWLSCLSRQTQRHPVDPAPCVPCVLCKVQSCHRPPPQLPSQLHIHDAGPSSLSPLPCSHTQGCQMQVGSSIRMKHSGLNVGHIWHHAQPLENASQFQISIPTLLGCLPTPLGLRPAVSTTSTHSSSFRPQSQDTIHTYYTRIEDSRLRNETHKGNTTSGSQPMPYCPYHRAASMPACALPRPAAQNNAMVSSWRNDTIEGRHAPHFSIPLRRVLTKSLPGRGV